MLRFRRPNWMNIALALLPAIVLGLSLPFLLVPKESPAFSARYATLLIACGAVVSVYALTLVVIVLRGARRAKDLAGDRDILKKRNVTLDGHVRALESEVELLTAMREVSRLSSDEVRFEKLAGSVLQVVRDLTDAKEVTLFLVDPGTKKLIPRATHDGQKARVAGRLTGVRMDADEAQGALDHLSVLRTVENDLLDVLVPLTADQQQIGVLHIAVELTGDAEEKSQRAETTEMILRDISRHIGLAIKMAALHARAVQDGATGLYNKEHFLTTLAESVADSRRDHASMSLIMLDIDHFKIINDTFGHPAGDEVLVQLSKALTSSLRRTDTAYRYGGEEIAILVMGAGLGIAVSLAERLRSKVESKKFRVTSGQGIDVTISLGVAELTDRMDNPADLVAAADAALYRAKKSGRNQVRAAE